jgi:hypothetical protein
METAYGLRGSANARRVSSSEPRAFGSTGLETMEGCTSSGVKHRAVKLWSMEAPENCMALSWEKLDKVSILYRALYIIQLTHTILYKG